MEYIIRTQDCDSEMVQITIQLIQEVVEALSKKGKEKKWNVSDDFKMFYAHCFEFLFFLQNNDEIQMSIYFLMKDLFEELGEKVTKEVDEERLAKYN